MVKGYKRPVFRQKHYEVLATEIKHLEDTDIGKSNILSFLCGVFERDNPKFNPQKFTKFAGIPYLVMLEQAEEYVRDNGLNREEVE